MPYNVEWLVEGRVMLVTLSGNLDLEAIDRLTETMTEYFNKGQPPLVHQIYDATSIGNFPTNIMEARKFAERYIRHPLVGWGMIITSNTTIKFIGAVVTGIAKTRSRIFGSMDEAITFLAEMDSTVSASLLASRGVSQPHS